MKNPSTLESSPEGGEAWNKRDPDLIWPPPVARGGDFGGKRNARSGALSLGLCLVLLFPGPTGVDAATLVVPPEVAAVEANGLYADTPPPTTGCRFQEVYPSDYFTSLMSQPGILVRMACRPDRSVTVPRDVVLRNFELRLSTTQRGPGGLSSRFEDNLGTDTTLVFSGDLAWSTQGTGPAQGPRAFDYVIPFQHPFAYDPSEGHLLVDWRVGDSPAGRPAFDAHLFADGKTRLRYGASANASTAVFANAGVAVREWTIEPLHLGIGRGPDSVLLWLEGPPGWSGRVQRSMDFETWTDWFGLTFGTGPYQINDPSSVSVPYQFYRLVIP